MLRLLLAVAGLGRAALPSATAARPPAKGGGRCTPGTGAAGCSGGGVCTPEGVCACDPAWTGARCDRLHLLPARPGGGFAPPGASTWGASVIRGDETSPVFHLFVNVFSGGCPAYGPPPGGNASGNGWWSYYATNANIQHYTSDRADGPWVWRDTPLPGYVSNNPLVTREPRRGLFLLWFEGMELEYDAPVCNRSDGRCVEQCGPRAQANATQGNQNPGPLSVASAASPHGPWRVEPTPVVEGRPGMFDDATLNKPAAHTRADGTTVVAYRTYYPLGRNRLWFIGIASAPRWQGPFAQSDAPAFSECAEDPVLWEDTRGALQMLVHNCSGVDGEGQPCHNHTGGPPPRWFFSSGSAWSPDGGGSRWVVRDAAPFAYDVDLSDGTVRRCHRREEPKVVLGDDGQPEWLVTVCAAENGTAWVPIQPVCARGQPCAAAAAAVGAG